MTVAEFLETLPASKQKEVRRKAKPFLREQVLSGGNDLWLAQELNINRALIELEATKKTGRYAKG